jgi:hypothetical protein
MQQRHSGFWYFWFRAEEENVKAPIFTSKNALAFVGRFRAYMALTLSISGFWPPSDVVFWLRSRGGSRVVGRG